MEVLDFKNTVWDLLRTILDDLDQTFRPVYEAYGLTMMQMRILIELKKQEETVGALGRKLNMAGANTSAMCRKLEQCGYLERQRDAEDQRVVKVQLSALGREAVQKAQAQIERRYSGILEDEKPEDIARIVEGLNELAALMQKMNHAK